MITTILHLSDLHRDSGSLLTTTSLMGSLARDRDRYVNNESIPSPDIAVISGDIIYGVGGWEKDGAQILAKQYEEAHDFLCGIAKEFFGGDRERVILVPGNHDVSMPHVVSSMQEVKTPLEDSKKGILVAKLFSPESRMRWSWKDFCAWEIIDQNLYDQRLLPYATFYEKFYDGKRSFPISPSEQFSVHDFPSLGLAFVGLNSCHENDLYNRTGRIHPDAISMAMRETAKLSAVGRICVGVWHHSIQGGPKETDYVDSDLVQSLMDGNCMLGMHGHQHRPQLLEHRFTPDKNRGISILSAGTLCGGPRTLPSGRMRAYNVVAIDKVNMTGTIHVRQMANTDFSSPVWGPGYVSEFAGSSVNFQMAGKRPPINVLSLADEADRLLRAGDPAGAYEIAKPHVQDPFLRKIAATALPRTAQWKEIVKVFEPPKSATEFIILSEAYEELEQWHALGALHKNWTASADSSVQQRIEMLAPTLKAKK